MRKRAGDFSVDIEWEAETERDPKTGRFIAQRREFRVEGTVESYRPAIIRRDPDDSCDAEGGEVEITEVTELLTRGTKGHPSYEELPSSTAVLDTLGLTEHAKQQLRQRAANYRDDNFDPDTAAELKREHAEDRAAGYFGDQD
jgi:hypothetical protein